MIDADTMATWQRLCDESTHAERFVAGQPTNADRFIEAAYDAMPLLLAEVARLRDDNANLERGVRGLTEVACTRMSADTYHRLTSDLAAANVALDAALQLDIGNEKLIDVMMRRYGREATQWRANHAQRKDERDAALADLAAARAERDEEIAARHAPEHHWECLQHTEMLEEERDAARAELATVKTRNVRLEALAARHDLKLREPGCQCTWEEGDSNCQVHPTCNGCGVIICECPKATP